MYKQSFGVPSVAVGLRHIFPAAASMLLFGAMLAACGGPVNTTPIAQPAGTPSPSPTLSPGPLAAMPATLAFSAVGLSQSVTLSDPNSSTGSFTVSGCSGVATYGAVVNGTLNVTAAAAGSCTITVQDIDLHSVAIAVTVSTLSVPIQ